MPPTTCSVCNGRLIGSELLHSTCGHCGGRSLDPNRRTQVAALEFRMEPSGVDLESVRSAYLEEGFSEVEAVPMPSNDRHRGWEVKVFASSSPYQKATS